jgi:hypothetical protein
LPREGKSVIRFAHTGTGSQEVSYQACLEKGNQLSGLPTRERVARKSVIRLA